MAKESDSQKVSRWARGVKNHALVLLLLTVVVLMVVSGYYIFYHPKTCTSFECFKTAMVSCNRVVYTNEEPEATLKYEVQGSSAGLCAVDVNLVQAKQGDLNIDKLAGFDMVCSYPLGFGGYPEKDLDKCHGRLKEELQSIIIEKLHTSVLENLESIKTSVASAI